MKIAVAGLGSIGLRHLRNLRTLGVADLIGCDPNPAARAAAAGLAPTVDTFDRLLDDRPDAVCLCTPNHLHAEGLARALEAGAHVFVEKPIAHRLDGLAQLAARADARGRIVLVACNMRFHPGVAAVRDVLAAGEIADACVLRGWFAHYLPNWRPGVDYRATYSAQAEQGGGIVFDAIHELDYARWLMGPIAAVRASGAHASSLEIDTEDLASLDIRFTSGASGSLALDYIRPVKSRGCEVYGPSGIVCWRSEGKSPERVHVALTRADGVTRSLVEQPAYDGNEMYLAELRHFLACLEGRETPAQSASDAIDVLGWAISARAAVTAGLQGATAP
jgi:predicted dehydrogenase